MTAFTVVWGTLLLVVGVPLFAWGFHAILRRPGWGGMYGKGALVTIVGFALAMFGLVNLLTV